MIDRNKLRETMVELINEKIVIHNKSIYPEYEGAIGTVKYVSGENNMNGSFSVGVKVEECEYSHMIDQTGGFIVYKEDGTEPFSIKPHNYEWNTEEN